MAKSPKIDTVFFLGSGVAENSWEPVIKAIKGSGIGVGTPEKLGDTDGEGANSFLVHIVNMRRHFHVLSRRKSIETAKRKQFLAGARMYAKAHEALKQSIATNLKAAADAGQIVLRRRFFEIANQWRGSCAFLTTNWDDLLERAMTSVGSDPSKVYHLHFGVKDPSNMLLPGEIIHEKYRPTRQRDALEEKIMKTWNVFQAAKRIVIYGHSLAPTESELRTVLHLGLDGAKGEIIIVNREKDLEGVEARLRPLLPANDAWTITTETV